MRRAVILSCGTRGDVEPFSALAARLVATGQWQVTFAVQRDYVGLVPSHASIAAHALPFAVADLAACCDPGPAGAFSPNFVVALARICARYVLPAGRALAAALADDRVAVVITSYITRPLALALARKERAQCVVVQLQPQVPTRDFPHHLSGPGAAAAGALQAEQTPVEAEKGDENWHSYEETERALFDIVRAPLDECCEAFGVPPLTFQELMDMSQGKHPSVTVFNAFPPELVDACSDAHPGVVQVGSLADTYLPLNWDASGVPAGLVDFLRTGVRPAVIGFGSMTARNGEEVEERMLLAMRRAGQERALLVRGGGEINAYDLQGPRDDDGSSSFAKRVIKLEDETVPYAWLFPQCDIVFCHGGAGVIGAALRAGNPLVVSPVIADQFLWARLVEARGLGSHVKEPLATATVDDLVEAIKTSRSSVVRAKCKDVAKDKVGHGCAHAVKLLEKYV